MVMGEDQENDQHKTCLWSEGPFDLLAAQSELSNIYCKDNLQIADIFSIHLCKNRRFY